jgi:hypothetical protein
MSETFMIPFDLPRLFSRPDRLSYPLYVVTTVFNSPRFRSRWKLYEDFELQCRHAGAILYTVEVAFGERDFVVTSADNPHHIQLRTWHELWLKENAINLAVQRLPSDWKKVAWVDADILFPRPDWADETKQTLEHWPIVQMWSQLHDMNADHELMGTIRSFADFWLSENGSIETKQVVAKPLYRYPYVYGKRGYPGAPGLAWAMRREAWDALGGLIDHCILGAGDWYMAHALTGQSHLVLRSDSGRLGHKIRVWENRARRGRWQERPILRNIGVVKGVAFHFWHGSKKFRRYHDRDQILRRHQFDPDVDLKRDWQGLFQLTDAKPQLRRDLQRYFRERNEDSIDP